MFYRPDDRDPRHGGLPHNPLNAIVAPRPIGWISTRASHGDNLAPYSYFNAVSSDPPQVMFAGDRKDSLRNIEETGVFAVNLVSRALLEVMNATSAHLPRGTDEFQAVGIEKAECTEIDCPRVASAPATLECRLIQVVPLEGGEDFLTLGRVVGVHIRDEFIREGRFDLSLVHPVGRLGYFDYAEVTELIPLRRPK